MTQNDASILLPFGALRFGLANKAKRRARPLCAEGRAGREESREAEAVSCHGIAHSNQMMMEVTGPYTPGTAFINPGTKLRRQLTRAATHRLSVLGWKGDYRPLGLCTDERAIVNACVGTACDSAKSGVSAMLAA